MESQKKTLDISDLKEGIVYKYTAKADKNTFYIGSYKKGPTSELIRVNGLVASGDWSSSASRAVGSSKQFTIESPSFVEYLFYVDNVDKNSYKDTLFKPFASYEGIYYIKDEICHKIANYKAGKLELEDWIIPILEFLKDETPLFIQGLSIPQKFKTMKEIKNSFKYRKPPVKKESGVVTKKGQKSFK